MYRLDKRKLGLLKRRALYAIRAETDGSEYAFGGFRSGSTDGQMQFNACDGRRVVVCHGSAGGGLSTYVATALGADVLLTCYPKRVIARYPCLAENYPQALRLVDTPLCVTTYWGWLFVLASDPHGWADWEVKPTQEG